MGIAKLLGLLIASAVLGVIVIASAALFTERHLIMEERRSSVRQNVESAHSLMVHFHAQAVAGKITQAQAQQSTKDALRAMRYSGNEYFWINDMHPTMVMHPIRPELDGKDLTENKDPTGMRLFVEFVRVVREREAGYVMYLWPKPGSTDPVLKASYVKGFAPWGWLVGSGVYVDTVDAAIRARVLQFGLGALLLAAVLAAIGVAIARRLLRQLGGEPGEAMRISERIAQGDLSVDIALKPGDNGSMLHAMQTMRDSIANIVGEVRAGTASIATASHEIAAGNNDLSARTEQQASALEQTAASMEELTGAVRQNAEHARQANELAATASEVAARGGAVVNQVIATMGAVNTSSRKIVDIISVIDGIAFQTNILALNAAVEAARAGEQGRGFAVVASEVRGLAQRSAAAAKEIKQLIDASVGSVEQGTQLVDEAGKTMAEVVASVAEVTRIIGDIASGSHQQSSDIEQINQAIAGMDQTTQQNAALVEEAASAAESLNHQAARLEQLVSVFKLRGGGGHAYPALQ
ncbi:hypothetical protein ASF43_01760 [Pseudorhodoferax sp. Leaf267]|nr:hypothetical protein ASF43_01760 [Pseudorhodoferax sp. Leaf267]